MFNIWTSRISYFFTLRLNVCSYAQLSWMLKNILLWFGLQIASLQDNQFSTWELLKVCRIVFWSTHQLFQGGVSPDIVAAKKVWKYKIILDFPYLSCPLSSAKICGNWYKGLSWSDQDGVLLWFGLPMASLQYYVLEYSSICEGLCTKIEMVFCIIKTPGDQHASSSTWLPWADCIDCYRTMSSDCTLLSLPSGFIVFHAYWHISKTLHGHSSVSRLIFHYTETTGWKFGAFKRLCITIEI